MLYICCTDLWKAYMKIMHIWKNPCFLYILYWYKELPEDDQDRAKHVGVINICVKNTILTLLHMLVLLYQFALMHGHDKH